MVINHLLNGMILQVRGPKDIFSGVRMSIPSSSSSLCIQNLLLPGKPIYQATIVPRFQIYRELTYESGQISIIRKPELIKGIVGRFPYTKPPFKVTSAEVVIVCPDECIGHTSSFSTIKKNKSPCCRATQGNIMIIDRFSSLRDSQKRGGHWYKVDLYNRYK